MSQNKDQVPCDLQSGDWADSFLNRIIESIIYWLYLMFWYEKRTLINATGLYIKGVNKRDYKVTDKVTAFFLCDSIF